MSPTTNKRTDEFGGCPENRARFTKLVVKEVRKQVGPMFPIFVRISADGTDGRWKHIRRIL